MSHETQSEDCPDLETEAPLVQKTVSTVFLGKLFNTLFILIVIIPCAYLFWLSFKNSLGWRFYLDLPFLLYTGYLMDHFSYIPYRDFFDMNMVGSHLTYMCIGKIFGYSDLGIRYADLTYIIAIMGATLLLTRNMGLRVMLLAPFIFAFWYLREGPAMTLQREILALPLIVLGTALSISFPKIPLYARALGAGIFFGMAATIKPHLAIGLVAVVLYLASENQSNEKGWLHWCRNVVCYAFFSACGLLLPLGAVAGFLFYNGALDEWAEVLFKYFPLYGSITGQMSVLPPGGRSDYMLKMILDMRHVNPLFPAGVIALVYGMGNPAYSPIVRKQVALLTGLAVVYWIYPMISGQFWHYHYFPFSYFMCCGMALALGPWSARALLIQRLVPVGVTLLVLTQLFKPYDDFSPVFQPRIASPSGGRPDAIAAYFHEHLKPGDKVQPLLDNAAGGMVHGMLLSGAEIATPFFYSFHFYHHVSNPFITEISGRFIKALTESPPRFILQNRVRNLYITGYDTRRDFPAVDNFLKQNYVPVQDRSDFVIWEYNPNAAKETEPLKPKKNFNPDAVRKIGIPPRQNLP